MKHVSAKTISVYFEKDLHLAIKKKAKSQDKSMSQYLRHLVRRDLEAVK